MLFDWCISISEDMKDTDGTDQLKTEFDIEVGIPHSYNVGQSLIEQENSSYWLLRKALLK